MLEDRAHLAFQKKPARTRKEWSLLECTSCLPKKLVKISKEYYLEDGYILPSKETSENK